ncbi:hypothetical protein IMG5_201340 [Ichthyophthirius multifiliis]|uniref:Uncharacterized protein n=1 Tax=Ichthyophthirius multifiliis TaxID=5932 RepID=G0R5Y8_ICHMU|nr:hypothetical protein IMG5_201340 [Ichthyophthirius multifiliis]EGR27112.1 hypothetical protein IMG5_201340 [Ichthyophthirius multifiliis]|eukprot:XP_004023996.1 hypothetical protein IMG5_201340 [Ichthyophthirius multifiliis]
MSREDTIQQFQDKVNYLDNKNIIKSKFVFSKKFQIQNMYQMNFIENMKSNILSLYIVIFKIINFKNKFQMILLIEYLIQKLNQMKIMLIQKTLNKFQNYICMKKYKIQKKQNKKKNQQEKQLFNLYKITMKKLKVYQKIPNRKLFRINNLFKILQNNKEVYYTKDYKKEKLTHCFNQKLFKVLEKSNLINMQKRQNLTNKIIKKFKQKKINQVTNQKNKTIKQKINRDQKPIFQKLKNLLIQLDYKKTNVMLFLKHLFVDYFKFISNELKINIFNLYQFFFFFFFFQNIQNKKQIKYQFVLLIKKMFTYIQKLFNYIQKPFILTLTFLTFLLFCSIYLNTQEQNENILFRKFMRTYKKQNEENAFEITAEFLTQHKYPVRQAKATLSIDKHVIEQRIDDNTGLATFSGKLQNSYSDQQQIQISIELIVGYNLEDTKKLKNIYNSSITIKKGVKTQSKQSFILTPILPKPTYIIGCVENDKKQPIEGAIVTASYTEPIFQDTVIEKTDSQGCFTIKADLEEYAPIKGDITIKKSPYKEWKIKEDSQYTSGFFLINDLKFKFKQPITLKANLIPIDIQGTVKDQFNKSIQNANIQLVCQSNVNKNHILTLKTVTDSSGKFRLQNETEFHPESKLSCSITITSQTNQYAIPYKEQFNLEEEKDFLKQPLEVKITPKELKGKVFGNIQNNFFKKPVENAKISLSFNSPLQSPIPQVSNKNGDFSFEFLAYEGDEYETTILVEKDQFQKAKIEKIKLNLANNYTYDAKTITLIYIPQPVQIVIQGKVFETTLKEPLKSAKVQIQITSQGKTEKLEVQTDQKGVFSAKHEAQNTQQYDIQLIIQGDKKYFEEFKPPAKKIDYNTGFSGDFGDIYIKRNPVQAQIQGILFEKGTKNAVSNSQISITAVQGEKSILPQQNIDCKTNQKGEYDCKFKAELGITYTIQLNILNSFKQSSSLIIGNISEQNNYTIKNLKSEVEFKLTPVDGIISGAIFSSENLKDPLKKGGQFKIISVQPNPLKEFDPKIQNIDDKGLFQIKLQLQLGKEYTITVEFSYPQLISRKQVFLLNYQNQYKLEKQQIIMGSPITIRIKQGLVNTLTNVPLDKVDVVLTLNENNQSFKTQTNLNGIFTFGEVVSLNSEEIKAKLNVLFIYIYFLFYNKLICKKQIQKKGFNQLISDVQFLKKNNYVIESLKLSLVSEPFKTSIQGVLLDENKIPVYLGQITLFVFDSQKKLINEKPQQEISNKQGVFNIEVMVTYNDFYTCKLEIKHDFFNNLEKEVVLDAKNSYQIKNLQVQLERKQTLLKYSGVIYNTHKQKIPEVPVLLKFSEESKKHQAVDLKSETDSYGIIEFEENILVGYIYNAFIQIKIANDKDYQEYNEEVEFKFENNYQLTNQQLIMYKKSVICEVSGLVQDFQTKKPIPNAQVLLQFEEFIGIQDQQQLFYADKLGKFTIKQKIQEGFTYELFLISKSAKYIDQKTKIQLQQSNLYVIKDLVINMKVATQSQYIQGQIKGFTLSNTGEYLKNSEIILYPDSDPEIKTIQKSGEKGLFSFEKIPLIQGNTYKFNLLQKPFDKNIYLQTITQVELSENESYQQVEIYLVSQRIKTQYNIQGKVVDKQSKKPITDAFVTIQFLDMINTKNTEGNSDQKGLFKLLGDINQGLDYQAIIIVEKAGYQPFTQTNIQLKSPYQMQNLNFELEQNNSSSSIYYVDVKNPISITGKLYEDTTCSLFPQKNIPFMQVLFFFEVDNSFNNQDILMGKSYTDLDGFFKIKTPHPTFSDIQSYFLFQKEGYQDLKRYLKIKTTRNYNGVDLGQIQILTTTGIKSNCSQKQQLKNKYFFFQIFFMIKNLLYINKKQYQKQQIKKNGKRLSVSLQSQKFFYLRKHSFYKINRNRSIWRNQNSQKYFKCRLIGNQIIQILKQLNIRIIYLKSRTKKTNCKSLYC